MITWKLSDKAFVASAEPPGARPIPRSILHGNRVANILYTSATLYGL